MKKLTNSIFIVFIIALLGCDTENDILLKKRLLVEDPPNEALTSDDIYFIPINPENICGAIVEKPLKANDEFIGGLLSIANDEDNIFVSFKTIEGWMIGETHLFLGDIENLPTTNSGNPILGHFPYKTYEEPQVEITISVLRSALVFEDENITIVAQAKIFKGEGEDLVTRSLFAEWDENLSFSGPRWGGGFEYEIQLCEELITVSESEVNNDLETEITEPVIPDVICLNQERRDLVIYDLGEEIIVGFVEFSFDTENFNFLYTLQENDWMIKTVHVNVGLLEESQSGSGQGKNNNKPIIGKFDFSESLVEPSVIYPFSIPLDEFSNDFLNGVCEIFIVHATLSKEVEQDGIIEVITKSAFAEWDIDIVSDNPKKGGYFEMCVIDCPVEL